jgi:hypothetical protein
MKNIFIFYLLLGCMGASYAQVGITSLQPDPSAVLDLKSVEKGFLMPRMTTEQRDAIVNPASGLMIFNTETSCINYVKQSEWVEVCEDIDNSFARIIYVNSTNPNTATVFSEAFPAVTHNASLIQNENYLYISTDGSTWTWSGTSYDTKSSLPTSPWNLQGSNQDAGANKTAKIWRTGAIMIGDAVDASNNFNGYFLTRGNMVSNPFIFAFENTAHTGTGFFMGNGGGANFMPILRLRSSAAFRSIIIGEVSNDTGNEPALQFRTQQPNLSPISTRPMWELVNGGVGGTRHVQVRANGFMAVGNHTATPDWMSMVHLV